MARQLKLSENVVKIVAIICISAITIEAITLGIDGVIIATSLSLIGGLLGYGIGRKKNPHR